MGLREKKNAKKFLDTASLRGRNYVQLVHNVEIHFPLDHILFIWLRKPEMEKVYFNMKRSPAERDVI